MILNVSPIKRCAQRKHGAKPGVENGSSVVGRPSEPVPGEDVSNLLDASPVMEEHTSNVI
jgi:hypothetical protein